MVWGVSIVGIGMALLICLVVTLSISYPLRRLKYAMSEYAQKDFYTKYEDMGNDQIAQVGSIFKSMVDRIRMLAREQVKNEKKISEEKMKQKEMYLSALQMQINPHFLYNMLDLVRWNIINMEHVNGRRVSRMISGYSEMLRYNIKLGDSYAKLWEELFCTKKYVKLLELLYDKKIDLSISCDEKARECLVAKLLLQPVIENTITHGKIHLLELPVIKIYVVTDEEEITISILNNGEIVDEDKVRVNGQVVSLVLRRKARGFFHISAEKMEQAFVKKRG